MPTATICKIWSRLEALAAAGADEHAIETFSMASRQLQATRV
jgi:hypothetical protein